MGEIRKYICSCGYEKDLQTGGGLSGCNVRRIAKHFPKETEAFLKEREEGRVKRYIMRSRIAKDVRRFMRCRHFLIRERTDIPAIFRETVRYAEALLCRRKRKSILHVPNAGKECSICL